MIKCLSPDQLVKFITENNLAYELDDKLRAIIIKATEGDVAWVWNADKLLFCWS